MLWKSETLYCCFRKQPSAHWTTKTNEKLTLYTHIFIHGSNRSLLPYFLVVYSFKSRYAIWKYILCEQKIYIVLSADNGDVASAMHINNILKRTTIRNKTVNEEKGRCNEYFSVALRLGNESALMDCCYYKSLSKTDDGIWKSRQNVF